MRRGNADKRTVFRRRAPGWKGQNRYCNDCDGGQAAFRISNFCRIIKSRLVQQKLRVKQKSPGTYFSTVHMAS